MRSGRQQEGVTHERARIFLPRPRHPRRISDALRRATRGFPQGAGAEPRRAARRPQGAHAPPHGKPGSHRRRDRRRLRRPQRIRDHVRRDLRFAGWAPRRAKAPGALDATAPAERRCAALSRRAQSADPAAARRRRGHRAVELSDLPELRAAHRRGRRGKPGNGQDVGEFPPPRRASRAGFRRNTCPRTSSPSFPMPAAEGLRSRHCRSTISSSPGRGPRGGR